MAEDVLQVEGLSVRYGGHGAQEAALREVSLSIASGEVVAAVGESGAGKSTLAATVPRLLPPSATITNGSVRFVREELTTASPARMRVLRGGEIAMVFQNPRAALNPIRRIGRQIADAVRAHRSLPRRGARAEVVALLEAVKIADPERVANAYAHELSGGQCQRALIALALAGRPRLLIADEPTTALDTVTGAAVMELLAGLVAERDMAMLLVTHDLALAAKRADRIVVMKAGRVVETGPSSSVLATPGDAYTRALVAATPRTGRGIEAIASEQLPPVRPVAVEAEPLLAVSDLSMRFGAVQALDRVSFEVRRGESLGIVGESGAGKSTLARLICRLDDPSAGAIRFEGREIGKIPARGFHRMPERRRIQLVFQDPGGSLDPRLTAFEAIAEPLRRMAALGGGCLKETVADLAERVQLSRELLERPPHTLSEGQAARVGIARAIALSPNLLVLDEPTGALDVSVQAAILTLLERLKREMGLSFVFISHDLAVVRMMCERVVVLRDGRVVEAGPTETVFSQPAEDYTRRLIEALPVLE
ncbi:nickel ABC transporter ATP-binding protein NikE [Amorphus sp. 3PC139-8]|uniref:nickel ABC transporter ATP-binding protein NikE n=1 Tax=Amorphus sp. 3PC139-8 TaxID=2735676 RepID=UPI00345CCAF4